MSNLTKGFAEMGMKRIAISGGENGIARMGKDEHMLRVGLIEGWE
jgi:hypothetical protein